MRPIDILSTYSALVVAFVAGLFSFLGLVIAKENKTSEFRQAWIDALRADLAKFVAAISQLSELGVVYDDSKIEVSEYYKLIQSALDTALTSETSILLRLNPDDKKENTKRLIEEIKNIRFLIAEAKFRDAKTRAYKLIQLAAPVLKSEWEQVKRGERIYQIAKWTAAAILIGTIILVVFVILRRTLTT